MEQITYQILNQVKEKMRQQGVYNQDVYKAFIEETIDEFRTQGKLTDMDSDEFIEDKLVGMWNEVEKEFVK